MCANALSRHNGTDIASTTLVERTIGVVFLGVMIYLETSHRDTRNEYNQDEEEKIN